LKNPPLTNANKENIKQNTIVKEVIKEVIIKGLESKELGFNLSSSEKTKLNNLPLQEVENYRNQLIKSKFNQLEGQVNALTKTKRERERERETKFILLWLLVALLVIITLNLVVKRVRIKSKKSK